MSTVINDWTNEVAPRVLEHLQSVELPITPKNVIVSETTDALGDDAWRILLVLPKPDGETWDRDAVFRARRAAINHLDQLAAVDGHELAGHTVAFVTTDEAAPNDIAEEETDITEEDASEDDEGPVHAH